MATSLEMMSQTGFLQSLQSISKDFQTYSNGEELFGLPVMDHPELKRTRKELNLFQKLYSLYNLVMDNIDGIVMVTYRCHGNI